MSGTLLEGCDTIIWCFVDGGGKLYLRRRSRISRKFSIGLESDDIDGHSIWLTSFSCSSNHSVTARALWIGALSSWRRPLLHFGSYLSFIRLRFLPQPFSRCPLGLGCTRPLKLQGTGAPDPLSKSWWIIKKKKNQLSET